MVHRVTAASKDHLDPQDLLVLWVTQADQVNPVLQDPRVMPVILDKLDLVEILVAMANAVSPVLLGNLDVLDLVEFGEHQETLVYPDFLVKVV